MFPNSAYAHPAGSFTVPMPLPGADPQDEPQISVSFNCAWLPYVRGAMTQLLLQSTWDTDDAGLGVVQSQVWRLISLFGDKDCSVCDCIQFVGGQPRKFVPDGHGGGSFVPVDPRTDGTVTPPWIHPPTGQTGNCLSGANNAATFKAAQNLLINVLGTTSLVASIIVGITDMFGLVIPVWGEVLAVVTNYALAAVDAGVVALSAAFQGADADTVYDKIKCLIECNAAADGTISASAIAGIKSQFEAYMPTSPMSGPDQLLWIYFFESWLDAQGPNGMTLLGASSGISSSDCSACTDCLWTHVFDFSLDDGGWAVDASGLGHYVAGNGFEDTRGVSFNPSYRGAEIARTFASTTIRTIKVEFDFSAGTLDPTGDNTFQIFTSAGAFNSVAIPATPSSPQVWAGSAAMTSIGVVVLPGATTSGGVDPGGSCKIRKITISGEGSDPF